MNKTKRKKNESIKRRYEAIKDLMSTFAMSTVAVVAAVTLIPASPKAEIIKSVALSEEVAYQVTVTDEENALDLSTLYVVLENQLEYYEEPLSLGENNGYFENLENDTQYRLSVYGNKGFGQERLDTLLITTGSKVGGTILSVTTEDVDFETTYFVDISVNDPESKYSLITLYYGYGFEQDTEIQYSSVVISADRAIIEITDIYTSNQIHMYLEGTTIDGPELLDEIEITPPFELYASIYPGYINSTEVRFHAYSDMSIENVTYEMNVYQNDLQIRKVIFEPEIGMHESSGFSITELSPNTTYYFECVIYYQNPQTLRLEESIIYQEELTTLNEYSYTYTTETFDGYIEVTITLDDPNDYFQNVYYETYDTTGEYDIYVTSETLFIETFNGEKSITFTIPIPTSETYQIIIGIRSQFDYIINQIIDTIIVE